nr:hypothetical protein GCM10025732_56360 [Glycomyces mayteni]
MDLKGSTAHAASTFPALSCAGMSGKATSVNPMPDGSPSSRRTDSRIVVSPMLLSVLTATVAAARSAGVWIGLSAGTMTAPKSSPATPVEATPFATISTGRPADCASSSEVMFENPKSNSCAATPGTIAAPPCASVSSTSMSRDAKNPCSIPR